MATQPRGKRRKAARPTPTVTEPVVPKRSITLPDPPPMEPDPAVFHFPAAEEIDGNPPADEGKKRPLTLAVDQAGLSDEQKQEDAPAPIADDRIRFEDFMVPVPKTVDEDEEDEDTDEVFGFLPGPSPLDPMPPTPVEPVDETDEAPIAPLPVPPEDTYTPLYNDLAGPRGPEPKEIDMTSPNPSSPAPQKPEENSRLVPALFALAGVAGVAILIVAIGLRRPEIDGEIKQIVVADVHATEPVAVASTTVAPPRPAEVPTPDVDVSAPQTAWGDGKAAFENTATTGYEADDPTVTTIAAKPDAPPAPVAKPVVIAAAPAPVAKPIVAATVAAPKPAAPPPAVAKPTVAAKVVAAAAPPAPPKATVPDSLVVSSMGPKPACKAECTWGNVSPTTGLPTVEDGAHAVICGDATYAVTKLSKIADGDQKYCYTVTGVTPH